MVRFASALAALAAAGGRRGGRPSWAAQQCVPGLCLPDHLTRAHASPLNLHLQGLQESSLHSNGSRAAGQKRLPIAYSPEWAALKEHVREMEMQ